jgi:hypothetical protein
MGIDIHSCRAPLGIDVGLGGQRLQGRPIHRLELRLPTAGKFFEGTAIQPIQTGGDRGVELRQTEEGLMPQAGQNPALDEQDPRFDLRLVAGFADAGRNHRDAVVPGQICVGRVQLWFIPAGLGDAAPQVIGHEDLRHATQIGEGPDMGPGPIRQRLRPGRLGIGVAGGAEDGDEDLGWPDLTGLPVLDRYGLARVIDEEFLAGAMLLPQTPIQRRPPGSIEIAEAAVLLAVRMLGFVLLPEQRPRHALP